MLKGGHLLCCDLCPRAFHPKSSACGIPAGDWCCEHGYLQRNTAQEGNTGLEARYYAVLQRVREQLEHGGTALSYFVKEVLPRLEYSTRRRRCGIGRRRRRRRRRPRDPSPSAGATPAA